MPVYLSNSEQETITFASGLAKNLCSGTVLAFTGGLGAGKTAFTRGLAQGLDCTDDVSSPTFSLVHEYAGGRLPLYHFDMYRISGYDDLCTTGFYDYLTMGGVLAVEWSENIAEYLPEETVFIKLEHTGDNSRKITVTYPKGDQLENIGS